MLSIMAVEFFFLVPFMPEVKTLLKTVKKSTKLIKSRRISDHRKEVVLLRYSLELIKSSMYLSLIFFSLLLTVYAGAFIFDWWIKPKPTTVNALLMPLGWVSMSVTSMAYLYFRSRFVRN